MHCLSTACTPHVHVHVHVPVPVPVPVPVHVHVHVHVPPQVGYATNADHGAGCNIHPPPKQVVIVSMAIE